MIIHAETLYFEIVNIPMILQGAVSELTKGN